METGILFDSLVISSTRGFTGGRAAVQYYVKNSVPKNKKVRRENLSD